MSAAIQLATQEDTALAHQRDPMADFRAMQEQAKALVKSGFLPKAVDTAEKAIAIMQTGRELGIGPMQALRCIHIIDGKPVMAAELIAGLVLSRHRGALLRVAETTEKECVVTAARSGQEATEYRFTLEDAQRAGLTGKQNWRGYPRAMLRNRAIAEAARGTFPDCTMGLYDPDELGAVTTERGEIVQQARGQSVASSVMGDAPPEPVPDGEEHPFQRLQAQLAKLEDLIAMCTRYEDALTILEELGAKSPHKSTALTRELQDLGPEKRVLSVPEYRELTKVWSRCDRQLTKKLKSLAPSVEQLMGEMGDKPDPSEPHGDK